MINLERIAKIEETRYENGEVVEYCHCDHSSLCHTASMPVDKYIASLEDDTIVVRYKCNVPGCNCVNFR